MNVKELKKINSDLIIEINKLSNKDKRNLVEINKLNIKIDMLKDSIELLHSDTTIIINDSTKVYPFSIINEYRDLQ